MKRLEAAVAALLLAAGAAGMAWRLELAEGRPAQRAADVPLFVCPLHGSPVDTTVEPIRALAPPQSSSSAPARISPATRSTSALSGRSPTTGSTLAARR